jgi:hypothetical protein
MDNASYMARGWPVCFPSSTLWCAGSQCDMLKTWLMQMNEKLIQTYERTVEVMARLWEIGLVEHSNTGS